MYMRVHRFHLIAETSMNKGLAGEGGVRNQGETACFSLHHSNFNVPKRNLWIYCQVLIANLSSISS